MHPMTKLKFSQDPYLVESLYWSCCSTRPYSYR